MGFLDKFLNQNNGQSTVFRKLVEKLGTSIKNTGTDLLNDSLGSVKDVVNGVGTSLSDLTKSKSSRNALDNSPIKNFHQKEVSIANLHGDAILNILNGVTDGNLLDAGLKALALYNYGTKWAIYTDQYVDKEMYPFKYSYLAEKTSTNANLDASETGVPSIDFLESIEDPTILGYSVKFDFINSPLFDLSRDASKPSTALNFVMNYKEQHPEMAHCETLLTYLKADFQRVFESGESLDSTTGYQGNLKQHYILSIDGLQKLDNPFIDFKDDELKITLHEDVRMYTNKMAYTYRDLVYSKTLGKKLIPENLLRFNLYIKISDQRSFTRATNDADRMRDAMRNAYSRIIYEIKDCELVFDNPLKEMVMGSFGSVDSAYANLTMRIKYRKVNRIFYTSLFSAGLEDFTLSDKFAVHKDELSMGFLSDTGFEDRQIKYVGDAASKRKSTNNNMMVVPSLSSQYSTLKNRGLFTSDDDDDSALTRFIKTLANKAVVKGMTYVDEGLDKVEAAIDNLGISVRDKLRNLVSANTISLGDVKDGFVSTLISAPEIKKLNTENNTQNNNNPTTKFIDATIGGITPITLANLSTDLPVEIPITANNINNGLIINTPTIELENLSTDTVETKPIVYNNLSPKDNSTVEIELENLSTPVGEVTPITFNKIHETNNKNIETPKEDLMNDFDKAKPLKTRVDLMSGFDKATSLDSEESFMSQDLQISNLSDKTSLMVPSTITNAIKENNLMHDKPIQDHIKTQELMEADKTSLTIKHDNLMQHKADIALIKNKNLTGEIPISESIEYNNVMKVNETEITPPVEDLVVIEKETIAVPTGNLMEVENGSIKSPDSESLMQPSIFKNYLKNKNK